MYESNSEFAETQAEKQDTNATSNLLAKPEQDSTSQIAVSGEVGISQAQAAKDSPPRPVETTSSSIELIALETTLDVIVAATVTLPVEAKAQAETSPVAKPVQARASMAPDPFEEDSDHEPPNFLRLTSALKALSPDCDGKTWACYRLAAMAYETRYFPALHDKLYNLCRDWSSGALCGTPSTKWNEPGSNGLSGKLDFDRVWRRLLKDTFAGRRVTLATIFWHAKQAGWEYSHDADDNNDKAVS